MSTLVRFVVVALCLVSSEPPPAAADPAPSGQMTWAVHFTLAPRWLHQIQRLLHDRNVFAPIWENGFIRGVGPRVEEPALALIPFHPYSAPYEDVRLKP